MGGGIPLASEMDEKSIALAMPTIDKYNMILKCKNLGIMLSADCLTPEDLDLVHEFYTTIETVRSKRG